MSAMKLVNKGDEPVGNSEVTWEDQQKIIQYSKNMTKLLSLQAKMENLKTLKQNLEDAQSEVYLVDESEGGVYTNFGDVYFNLSTDEAIEQLDKVSAKYQDLFENYETEEQRLEQLLMELKVQLTSKFGKAINLEID